MTEFTPISALAGGALIGLAAAWLLLSLGRIAGISGIFAGILAPKGSGWFPEWSWRLAFVVGLPAGALIYRYLWPEIPAPVVDAAAPLAIAGGLLVGFGTRLGGGCTSGHGVCGMARASKRSIAATITFMGVAVVTVFVVRHMAG